jgi:hypothetical protein
MTTGSSALVSLGLLRERLPGERRVALTPADVKRLSAKAIVTVETGAGPEAGFPDVAYANAGAHLAGLQQVLDGSAVIAKVRTPDASQTPGAGGVLISLGGRDAGLAKRLQERPVSHLALERVPWISRAQATRHRRLGQARQREGVLRCGKRSLRRTEDVDAVGRCTSIALGPWSAGQRGLRHRIERFVQSPSTLRRSLCPCSLIQSKSVDWTKRRSPPLTRDAAL